MGENFRSLGVFFGGDVARFFEHRHVDIGFNIACRTGVAVPIPCSAKVACLVDNSHICDPPLRQLGSGHQATNAGTDDRDFGFGGDGFSCEIGIGVRIAIKILKNARKIAILASRIGSQTLYALGLIFLGDRVQLRARCIIQGIRHYHPLLLCLQVYT